MGTVKLNYGGRFKSEAVIVNRRTAIHGNAEYRAAGHGRQAARMAGSAVSVAGFGFDFDIRRRCGRLLVLLVAVVSLMLMVVMTEMIAERNRADIGLMPAIPGRSCPGKVQRQKHQQENQQTFTHSTRSVSAPAEICPI